MCVHVSAYVCMRVCVWGGTRGGQRLTLCVVSDKNPS